MSITREQAIDQMLTHAKEACESGGILVADMVWSGVAADFPGQPDGNGNLPSWAQIYVKHADSKRVGFRGNRKHLFKPTGTLWIKMFVPIGDGTVNHVPLTQAVLTYFESLRLSSISYANIRAVEDGKHGLFYVTDFTAFFSYDVIN